MWDKQKFTGSECMVWARLQQALASTLQKLCDDPSDTVLIENKGVTPD